MGLFAASAFTIYIMYSVFFLIFNHLLVHNYDKTSYISFLLNAFVLDEKSRNV